MTTALTVLSLVAQSHLIAPTLVMGVPDRLSPAKELALGLVALAPTPVVTVPSAPPPQIYSLNSTSYCTSGIMADGQETYEGAVANNMWPLGTRLLILSGEHAGETVTIADHIGWGSQLDFFTWSCAAAWVYGREEVNVEVLK